MEFMCNLSFRQSCGRPCNYTVIGFDKTTVCDWQETFLELLQEDRPDNHQFYWDTVYRLVLQGQIDNVRRLLSIHSAARSDSIYIEMNAYVFSHVSMPICIRIWYEMQTLARWCQRRLKENEIATNLNIETTWQRLCVYRVANYL